MSVIIRPSQPDLNFQSQNQVINGNHLHSMNHPFTLNSTKNIKVWHIDMLHILHLRREIPLIKM